MVRWIGLTTSMATSNPEDSLEMLLKQIHGLLTDGNALQLAERTLFWDHQDQVLEREEKINKQAQDNWLKQFDFANEQADEERAYRNKMLLRDDQRRKDEADYRNKLLLRQDQQDAWDRDERARVRADSQKQFQMQFDAQKKYNADNLAFQKERADKSDAARVRAEVQAEAGTRRQVLAGLGFHNQQARTSSPFEALLLQGGKRQRPRLRSSY